jgi:hypothetical protein
MKKTFLNDNIKSILAIVIVLAALAYFFLAAFCGFKCDEDIKSQITIAVVSVLSTATGYYFGSSAGSAKKDDTIAETINKNPGQSTTNLKN